MSDNQKWEIIQGDALKVLSGFAPGTFDAVITDPPYASGGRTQAEKNKSTAKKYSSMRENAPPPFDGDAKDQRSWTRWAAEWLYEARKVCKPGAPVCMFIDWRQLPAATDALQWPVGSGEAPQFGIRATAARRRGASASRQSTSSGAPTEICPSTVRCLVCLVCLSTEIRRTASTSLKSLCSSCRTS